MRLFSLKPVESRVFPFRDMTLAWSGLRGRDVADRGRWGRMDDARGSNGLGEADIDWRGLRGEPDKEVLKESRQHLN